MPRFSRMHPSAGLRNRDMVSSSVITDWRSTPPSRPWRSSRV